MGFRVRKLVILKVLGSFIDADIGPFNPSIPKDWGNAKEEASCDEISNTVHWKSCSVFVISTFHI